jgi:hypothetical protein
MIPLWQRLVKVPTMKEVGNRLSRDWLTGGSAGQKKMARLEAFARKRGGQVDPSPRYAEQRNSSRGSLVRKKYINGWKALLHSRSVSSVA